MQKKKKKNLQVKNAPFKLVFQIKLLQKIHLINCYFKFKSS